MAVNTLHNPNRYTSCRKPKCNLPAQYARTGLSVAFGSNLYLGTWRNRTKYLDVTSMSCRCWRNATLRGSGVTCDTGQRAVPSNSSKFDGSDVQIARELVAGLHDGRRRMHITAVVTSLMVTRNRSHQLLWGICIELHSISEFASGTSLWHQRNNLWAGNA